MSPAFAKAYDGIWFLGFNLHKAPFNSLKVRQAVAHCIDLEKITAYAGDEAIIPGSVIPPGMKGNDPSLLPYGHDIELAKKLMRESKSAWKSKKNLKITLLHTDGIKTIAIARQIKQDLAQLGFEVALAQDQYQENSKWDRDLASKKFSLFLMGYKSFADMGITEEAGNKAQELVSALFSGAGKANFTGYKNPKLEKMLSQEPTAEIARIIYHDLPVIGLFYIEKF